MVEVLPPSQLEVQPPVTPVDHPLTYEKAAARLEGPGRSYLERLDEAISTDLNTAQALAVLTRASTAPSRRHVARE